MAEIGLDEFVSQVKRELLEINQAQRARDPYPLFGVSQIELELTVMAQTTLEGGLRLTVADAEASFGASSQRERGHLVRLTLTPLVPLSELAAELLQDPRARDEIKRDLRRALLKGDEGRLGDPE